MTRQMFRATRRGVMVAAVAALAFAGTAEAQQRTNFKFALNFAFDGSNAPYMLAADRGYFAAEGLNVTLDATPGGTAEAVTRVASGTYDASFADVNFLVDFNAKNPAKTLRSVYVVYNRSPLAIITLKKSGIAKPADLKGRSLGAPAGDGAFRLFPLFSKVTGIAIADVKTQTMDMRLREAMLIKGEVDAVTGFDSSVWFNLKGQGVKAEDVNFIYYGDYGLDLYSNSIVTTPQLMQEKPEVLKAFLRAVTKGYQDALADPKAAIDALQRRDGLIKPEIELERLQWLIKNQIVTAESREIGLGAVKADRFQRSLGAVAEAFGLSEAPKADTVFSDAFLPGLAERKPKN
jgi:NitT/TauT family transport system substrate-binding protein